MFLRLLRLITLCTLSLSNQDLPDNSQFYNERAHDFEDTPEGWVSRLPRSLTNNFTDMSGNTIGPAGIPVMFPDTSICDVVLKSSEPISIDQIPFFCLCSHCKATTGPKGERGDRGLQGFQGSPGRRGLMGFRGPRGFTGAGGVKGQKGDQGDKGQPGPIGFTGMKGALGVKGEKGDHGDDGPAGPVGLQGEAGSCLCEPIIGPPGLQGPPGPAGARGLPGTLGSKGATGAKGDKGDVGVNGRNGADGLKGEQGDPGACDCNDGVDGLDGQKGQKGETGIKGDIGPKGLQGDKGIPGEMGDPGMPGIPGPCTLAVQSAFSVSLETPFPAMNIPVHFTKEIYNVQGHYNTILGMYIVPVNGTYVCDFHLAVKDKILIVALYHNFYPVLKITETTNLATASQNIVLYLKERDLIWLQVKDENSNGMFTDAESSSTFSCFLQSPDSCHFEGFRDFHTVNVTALQTRIFLWVN